MNGFKALLPASGDRRGFVHKRVGRAIVGGVKGFVGGGVTGAISGAGRGFIGTGGGPSITPAGCPPGFTLTAEGGCAPRSVTVRAPAFQRFRESIRAPTPVTPVPGVAGFVQRVIPGGRTGFEVAPPPGVLAFDDPAMGIPSAAMAAPGVATLGRFGAAVEPTFRTSTIRDCPRGMVLAVDSLCYSRRDVRNSERFWPRGRRPLLTGGEMRAISTAAAAAKKLQRKQKDLMSLGLLPKPKARSKKAAVPGHKATLEHN